MNQSLLKRKKVPIFTAGYFEALLRIVMKGYLVAQVFLLSLATNQRLEPLVQNINPKLILGLSVTGLALAFTYLFFRGAIKKFFVIYESNRFDALVVFVAGIYLGIQFQEPFAGYYSSALEALSDSQIISIIVLPFIFFFAVFYRGLQLNFSKNEKRSFLLSDKEKKSKHDDLLNLSDEAVRFAERIYNNGSTESIVFGIDAPWGIGKSSFVNFCKESLDEKYNKQIIVYEFSPLRYDSNAKLLPAFIDGLVHTIQKNVFAPEVRPLISKYSRLIKTKLSFSLERYHDHTRSIYCR